jgi:hypothetical protein
MRIWWIPAAEHSVGMLVFEVLSPGDWIHSAADPGS